MSNWWSLPIGATHHFLSINAGCVRLLIPHSLETAIPEMRTGVQRIFVTGNISHDGPAVEILFDDGSDRPYVMLLDDNQIDRRIGVASAKRTVDFVAYVDRGVPEVAFATTAYLRAGLWLPGFPGIDPAEFTA